MHKNRAEIYIIADADSKLLWSLLVSSRQISFFIIGYLTWLNFRVEKFSRTPKMT